MMAHCKLQASIIAIGSYLLICLICLHLICNSFWTLSDSFGRVLSIVLYCPKLSIWQFQLYLHTVLLPTIDGAFSCLENSLPLPLSSLPAHSPTCPHAISVHLVSISLDALLQFSNCSSHKLNWWGLKLNQSHVSCEDLCVWSQEQNWFCTKREQLEPGRKLSLKCEDATHIAGKRFTQLCDNQMPMYLAFQSKNPRPNLEWTLHLSYPPVT